MPPVTLLFEEKVNFLLFVSVHHPIVLGSLWLLKCKPHIDWYTGRLLEWERTVKTLFWTETLPRMGFLRDQRSMSSVKAQVLSWGV